MEIGKPNNLPERRGEFQCTFDEDLVLPKDVFADLIAAADMLTAFGKGLFYISETDYNDPDGVRVHYRGNREFTEFASLADTITKEVDQGKTLEEIMNTIVLTNPKTTPKNQGNSYHF